MNTVNVAYDELLVGQRQYLDINNFRTDNYRQKEAVACIRYVIEKVLLWTFDDAVKKLDDYMIRLMKLDSLIKHIHFPLEVPYGDPRYILSLVYPDKIHIDRRQMIESMYKTVLDAGSNDDVALKQFPRNYFAGGDGFVRFCVCVAYLIENFKPMDSVEEMYEFFTSSEGKRFLYDYRLRVPADQFSLDILEVLRAITEEEEDGQFVYSFYRFKKMFSKLYDNN